MSTDDDIEAEDDIEDTLSIPRRIHLYETPTDPLASRFGSRIASILGFSSRILIEISSLPKYSPSTFLIIHRPLHH